MLKNSLSFFVALNFVLFGLPFFNTCNQHIESVAPIQFDQNSNDTIIKNSNDTLIESSDNSIFDTEVNESFYEFTYDFIESFDEDSINLIGVMVVLFIIIMGIGLIMLFLIFRNKYQYIFKLSALMFFINLTNFVLVHYLLLLILNPKYGFYLLFINISIIFVLSYFYTSKNNKLD
jgi:hypothetical protein